MSEIIKRILFVAFAGFWGMTFLNYFLNYRDFPFRQVMFDCMKDAIPGALIFLVFFFLVIKKASKKQDDDLKSNVIKKSFCSKCGAKVSQIDIFCSECGHALE
jgi:hypothetical protein